MKNCFVLLVKIGYEEKVAQILKSKLEPSLFLPFIPSKEILFRRNGITSKINEICFRGYIFIESEHCIDEFIIRICPFIRMINEIYKIVNYGDKQDIAMRENERTMLKGLYGSNYCIKGSVGFIESDRIRIIEGALMGIESIIKKINRHKREAIIEIEFMGGLRQITVGLEIVEKI